MTPVFFPCYHFPVRWRRAGSVWYKTGFAWQGPLPRPYTAAHLRDFFWQQGVPFAVVEETEKEAVAYTDPVRSIPLYYARTAQGWRLSDSALMLARQAGSHACRQERAVEWQHIYCVMGQDTLLPHVYQLQPYQRWHLDKHSGNCEVSTLHHPFEACGTDGEPSMWERRFRTLLEALAHRMAAQAGGRPMVVPLSGGKDSRLVLALLKTAGVSDLHAYTYGAPDSAEVKIARKVAQHLNVRWHFVPYSPAVFRNYLTARGLQYDRFASQYAGLAHEQDFFALWKLKSEGALPADAVIVSGMCTDAQNGSRIVLPPDYPRDAAHLARWIAKKFFPEKEADDALLARIAGDLPPGPYSTYTQALNAYEWWRTVNRLSKFSMTTMRTFEFWGWQWMAPFWTHAVVSFWQEMPYALRENRRLFLSVVRRHFFRKLGIDFPSPMEVPAWMAALKRPLRKVPGLQRWRKRRRAVDPNALWAFADLLREDAGLPEADYRDENEVHALWFLRRQCPPFRA